MSLYLPILHKLRVILKAAPGLQTYTALLTTQIKDSSLKPPGLFPMSVNTLTLTAAFVLEFSLFPPLIYAINKTHFWVIYSQSTLWSISTKLCYSPPPPHPRPRPVNSCCFCLQSHITETHLDSVIFHFGKHADPAYKQL